jgi:hypothetical protein
VNIMLNGLETVPTLLTATVTRPSRKVIGWLLTSWDRAVLKLSVTFPGGPTSVVRTAAMSTGEILGDIDWTEPTFLHRGSCPKAITSSDFCCPPHGLGRAKARRTLEDTMMRQAVAD